MTQRRDFDAAAAAWDEEPRRVKLAGEIAAGIAANVPLSAEWDALDFGCGTGLVTLPLSQHLGSMVGLDSSDGMLDRLRNKIQALGCKNVHTTLCNLEKGELPPGRFHLITSAMTLHHIPEIVPVLQSLRSLLHPGGWIALADLEREDGSFHDEQTGVFHNGFSAEEFQGMLEKAGFSSISISTVSRIEKGARSFPVLLATAQSQ
ncbi:MAG: class I SAM-dependent methyltransferase [Desulfuromonadales bacterium]